MDHLRSGVRGQPGQYGKILFLKKIQKLAGCGGWHLESQLHGRLRQKNRLNQEVKIAVSQDRAIVLQPGQSSETLSQKKKADRLQALYCALCYLQWVCVCVCLYFSLLIFECLP